MAKLRLVMWVAATGFAATVLLWDIEWSEHPATAVMAVVRMTAGLLAVYLCVATVLAIRLPRLAPRFVRRLVAAAVGAGLLVAPLAASAEPRPRPPGEAPVLRRQAEPAREPRAGDLAMPAATSTRRQTDEVVVAPGDHLWSIAERALAGRLGRPPSDAEVVPFWLELIELNRPRLATTDADLIFVGQVFRLPS